MGRTLSKGPSEYESLLSLSTTPSPGGARGGVLGPFPTAPHSRTGHMRAWRVAWPSHCTRASPWVLPTFQDPWGFPVRDVLVPRDQGSTTVNPAACAQMMKRPRGARSPPRPAGESNQQGWPGRKGCAGGTHASSRWHWCCCSHLGPSRWPAEPGTRCLGAVGSRRSSESRESEPPCFPESGASGGKAAAGSHPCPQAGDSRRPSGQEAGWQGPGSSWQEEQGLQGQGRNRFGMTQTPCRCLLCLPFPCALLLGTKRAPNTASLQIQLPPHTVSSLTV